MNHAMNRADRRASGQRRIPKRRKVSRSVAHLVTAVPVDYRGSGFRYAAVPNHLAELLQRAAGEHSTVLR